MARILIATDAWSPQINGVVRTLETTVRMLSDHGDTVDVVEPSRFPRIPLPFYREIALALPWPHAPGIQARQFAPDSVHIATEGPIGLSMRHACRRFGWRYTTSYHTRFPEYLQSLLGVPARWSYRYMRWFHRAAAATMVATPSLERELMDRGFSSPIRRWSRGVDLTLFQAGERRPTADPRPVMLYVGRISSEKGLEDFLRLSLPGTKILVGDGPARADLQRRYPDAVFPGVCRGPDLAAWYSAADVFVFPSRTDTFGIVLIEALACGLPVAAYPVTGPIDIITRPELGCLDNDLAGAIRTALARGDRDACIREGQSYTWDRSVDQFRSNLVPVRSLP